MRLVFLGDIQGNLTALESVLADVKVRAADAIYHLGNVVGPDADSGRVIDRLRAGGILGVRGAWDELVAGGGAISRLPEARASEERGIARVRSQLDSAQLQWLAEQPTMRVIPTGSMEMALYSATPVSFLDIPHREQPDDYFREMASYVDARVHAFASSPDPFWRVVDGRWFVGAGSVGSPRGPESPFALVDVNGGAAVRIGFVPLGRMQDTA